MPTINTYIVCLLVLLKHIFCMTIFYIPNAAQYLNVTTTLLTINKQQIRCLLNQKSVNNLLIARIEP